MVRNVNIRISQLLVVIWSSVSGASIIGRQSFKMNHACYAYDEDYSRIANSNFYLGLAYVNQGELEEPLSMGDKSLGMKRPIHEHEKEHLEMITSLSNLALAYKGQGKLIERIQFHEGSLVM